MKRSDLYREYARVIDMCEGTSVIPFACVKYFSDKLCTSPSFTTNFKAYSFAIGICEGMPVFPGDTLYHDRVGALVMCNQSYRFEEFTWTKLVEFKIGEPVMVKESPSSPELERYFAGNDKCFSNGQDAWTDRGVKYSKPSSWAFIRKLTPEELAEHDHIVNSWRK